MQPGAKVPTAAWLVRPYPSEGLQLECLAKVENSSWRGGSERGFRSLARRDDEHNFARGGSAAWCAKVASSEIN